MANPETIPTTFTIKKLDGSHEADDMIRNHAKRPTEIVCVKRGEDGRLVTITRIPSLHQKHGMTDELDKLFVDMLSADEVIIRERTRASPSPHARQMPGEERRPFSQ